MIKAIKRFIERGRKGYCYKDLWSFDNWLSKTITRGLREFKENCHSYPSEDITWEGWMKVLDEIIECFEEQTRNGDNFPSGNVVETWRRCQTHKANMLHRGLYLLERYYYDLWD